MRMGTQYCAGAGSFRVCSHGYRSARVSGKSDDAVRIATLNVDGRNEVRAVYGGFGLVISGLLLMAAVDGTPSHRNGALTVGMALLGMALGRIVSGIVDRGISRWPATIYDRRVNGGAMLIYAAFLGRPCHACQCDHRPKRKKACRYRVSATMVRRFPYWKNQPERRASRNANHALNPLQCTPIAPTQRWESNARNRQATIHCKK